MAHSDNPEAGPITSINVTPLVDITLVLLIIFMVTARLIVSQQALNVDLPQASTGNELHDIFGVVLQANGAIEVDGEILAEDEAVLAHARAARSRHHDLRAVVYADVSVAHGRVMHVLDLLREAGVFRIGFGVVPPAQNPTPYR